MSSSQFEVGPMHLERCSYPATSCHERIGVLVIACCCAQVREHITFFLSSNFLSRGDGALVIACCCTRVREQVLANALLGLCDFVRLNRLQLWFRTCPKCVRCCFVMGTVRAEPPCVLTRVRFRPCLWCCQRLSCDWRRVCFRFSRLTDTCESAGWRIQRMAWMRPAGPKRPSVSLCGRGPTQQDSSRNQHRWTFKIHSHHHPYSTSKVSV